MSKKSDVGTRYLQYMEEIKWRCIAIGEKLERVRKSPGAEGAILEVEFCFLQVRFVCELIALASLSAHLTYGLNKKLLEEWHADEIFAELEALNSFCFPVPVKLDADASGLKSFTPQPNAGITCRQLKDIYGRCGDALHRGVLMHTLKGKTRRYDVDALWDWFQRIVSTLGEHLILFPKENRALLVNMHVGPGGDIMVIEAEADEAFAVSSEFQPPESKPLRPHRDD